MSKEIPGHEIVCQAETCIHNDNPICKIHTQDNPIKLSYYGSCLNYTFSFEKAVAYVYKG